MHFKHNLQQESSHMATVVGPYIASLQRYDMSTLEKCMHNALPRGPTWYYQVLEPGAKISLIANHLSIE